MLQKKTGQKLNDVLDNIACVANNIFKEIVMNLAIGLPFWNILCMICREHCSRLKSMGI